MPRQIHRAPAPRKRDSRGARTTSAQRTDEFSYRFITEGKEIPDASLVMGSPGKVVRQLSEQEIQRINGTAGNYVRRFKRYRTDFRPDE